MRQLLSWTSLRSDAHASPDFQEHCWLGIDPAPDTAAAHARVIAADGRAYEALYPLKRQANGQWRIDGCHLRPARGQSL